MSTSKKLSGKTEQNIHQLEQTLSHLIDNNRYLASKGLPSISLNVEGDAGIGKTSVVKQIARKKDLSMVRLNLAELDDLGDLVGFPVRQFEMITSEGTPGTDDYSEVREWVDEHALADYEKMGYKFTKQNRTGYCPPEWISGKTGGGILLLDDYTRA
jgi:MoxR-like ATPase